MSDIFISYASEDKEKAKPLAEVLEKQGWSVWWDKRIPSGKTFADVIEKELDSSQCVVVLWSKASIKKRWVKTEASEGAKRDILIPVLIEDVKVPIEFRLIQAASLIDWQGQKNHPVVNKLIDDVEAILGIPRVEKKKSTVIGKTDEEQLEKDQKPVFPRIPETRGSLSEFPREPVFPRGLEFLKELAFPREPVIPKTKFRSTPKRNLSEDSVKDMLKRNDFFCKDCDWNKRYSNPNGGGFQNNFEEKIKNGDKVILDHASGLMWQQSGSKEYENYENSKAYVNQLNQVQFAGYSDWRFPTLEEAMSLMEPMKNSDDLYIDSLFDSNQSCIWTSDVCSGSRCWTATFIVGSCFNGTHGYDHVRAVR